MPRRGGGSRSSSSSGGDDDDSSIYTYRYRGYFDQSMYWEIINIVLNSIYLFSIIGLIILVRKLHKTGQKCKGLAFYFLVTSLYFIAVTTALSITGNALWLADAWVEIYYQLINGVYALMNYPGKSALIASIHIFMHERLQGFSGGKPSKKVGVVGFLIVGLFFSISGSLVYYNFKYAVDMINILQNGASVTMDLVPRAWPRISTTYNALMLVAGIYIMCFAAYLRSRANKQATFNTDIIIIMSMVAPAIIVDGLFGTITSAMSYHILMETAHLALAATCISSSAMVCALAGMVWIFYKREKLVTTAAYTDVANTVDPENRFSIIH